MGHTMVMLPLMYKFGREVKPHYECNEDHPNSPPNLDV